ncbi:5-methylcytosine restriction system specificity protein McrC [Bifidobacterium choerinum]|nr:hypothetical protein [Bifidobacterium choerinum]
MSEQDPQSWAPWISDAREIRYLARDNSALNQLGAPDANDQVPLQWAYDHSSDFSSRPGGGEQITEDSPVLPPWMLSSEQHGFIQKELVGTVVRNHPNWFYFGYESGNDDEKEFDAKQPLLNYGPWPQADGPVLSTQNVAGIIRNDDGSFQMSISSRFSGSKDDSPVHLGQDRFFNYMMERVMHFNLLSLDFSADPKSSWSQLIRMLFPSLLQKAVQKGMYRQYVRRYHNDPHPRGRIDVARHIRTNTPFMGSVSYSTREFDADNPVTELIRHTIEFLDDQDARARSLLQRDDQTRKCVEQIRQATLHYEENERRKVISTNIRRPVLHPFYQDYRELQRLCLDILAERGVEYAATDRYQLNGVLFDCSWLWESYLNVILEEYALQQENITMQHPDNKGRKHAYPVFKEVQEDEEEEEWKNLYTLFPDFLFDYRTMAEDEEQDHIIVADAKYKPADGIGRDDRFQLLAYMLRFESNLALDLSPQRRENADAPAYELKQYAVARGCDLIPKERTPQKLNQHVARIRLNVSDVGIDSYEEYCEVMKKRECEFLTRIAGIMGSSAGNETTRR